jgi:hypothetical protein
LSGFETNVKVVVEERKEGMYVCCRYVGTVVGEISFQKSFVSFPGMKPKTKSKKNVEMSVDEMLVHEILVNEMSVDEISVNEILVDEMLVDEMLANKGWLMKCRFMKCQLMKCGYV